jgi:hypothetical protein
MRPLRVPLVRLCLMASLTLVLLAIVAVKIWKYTYGPKFIANNYRTLDQPVPDDFWFAPDGRLVTVRVGAPGVSIFIWDLVRDKYEERTFALGRLSVKGNSARYILDKCGENIPPESLASSVIFTISQDGKSAAWVENGFLSLADVLSHDIHYKGLPFKLSAGSYVEHLSITGPQLVTVLYDNGTLESIDLAHRRAGAAGTALFGGWALWSHGPVMAFSHFASGNAALVQIMGPDKIEHFAHQDISGGISVAAWGSDRLAIGRRDGSVAMLRRNMAPGPSSSVPLGPVRQVWAVAFYNPDRMFAGGDFVGVYDVEYRANVFRSHLLFNDPVGVRRIAASGDCIAVLTSSALGVASIGYHPALSDDGVFVVTLVSLLVSVVGLVLSAWPFLKDKRGKRSL